MAQAASDIKQTRPACCRVKLMYGHVNKKNGQAAPLVSEELYNIVMAVRRGALPLIVWLVQCTALRADSPTEAPSMMPCGRPPRLADVASLIVCITCSDPTSSSLKLRGRGVKHCPARHIFFLACWPHHDDALVRFAAERGEAGQQHHLRPRLRLRLFWLQGVPALHWPVSVTWS